MANVLGALFQDIADAIRRKTGDTATMKPAEFPEKIKTIEVGGGARTKEFLPTTTATNMFLETFAAFGMAVFIDEDTYNVWNENTNPVMVEYDGQTYTCEVQDLNGVAAVGNLTTLGGTGNDEPFAISSGITSESDGNTIYFLLIGSTVDIAPTEHTIRIYQNDSDGEVSIGEDWLYASGDVKLDSAGSCVVTHGLGIEPDIVFLTINVFGKLDISSDQIFIMNGFNLSAKLIGSVGEEDKLLGNLMLLNPSNNGIMTVSVFNSLENLTSDSITSVCNVTSSTMQLGCTNYQLMPGYTYTWIAYARKPADA